MNDEIREILEYLKNNTFIPDETKRKYKILHRDEVNKLLDYITNLQQENERLKEKLNCKEYFSSTMPEDTEFVILTKNNYDRQQKDIQLELIDYKLRVEKAIECINKNKHLSMFADCREPEEEWNYDLEINPRDLLNILKNGDDEE